MAPNAVERALTYSRTGKVRAACHRGAHWQECVEMAQWWSDYLDQLRKGAQVINLFKLMLERDFIDHGHC